MSLESLNKKLNILQDKLSLATETRKRKNSYHKSVTSPREEKIRTQISQCRQEISRASIKEEAPANAAGSGAVAGIGVGQDGEPGFTPKAIKKYQSKNKKGAVLGFKAFRRQAKAIGIEESLAHMMGKPSVESKKIAKKFAGTKVTPDRNNSSGMHTSTIDFPQNKHHIYRVLDHLVKTKWKPQPSSYNDDTGVHVYHYTKSSPHIDHKLTLHSKVHGDDINAVKAVHTIRKASD